MSCYLRHLYELLEDIDLKPETKIEREEIDLKIRHAIGMKSSDKCNEVWKELKTWLSNDAKKSELESILKK